ncbi:MAG: single-stranded DNA-binding protein [Verrucomicrobia bacterium]|nr:single-stranded DNA-binding protein [Verrucomicrobiota bacterium]
MNQMTIAGHLGADPEVRFTSSGQKVTTLRVAARVRRGSKGDDTIWWRVTVWGDQFDKMIPFLKKGSPIIVFGELSKPEIFTDREGRPQVSMNITANNLLFSPFGRPDSQGNDEHEEGHQGFGGQQQQQQQPKKQYGQAIERPAENFADEEIPF